MILERRTIIILAAIGAFLIGAVYWVDSIISPPRDAQFVRKLHTQKPDLERLRRMMQEDAGLYSVAHWGVCGKQKRLLPVSLQEAGITESRYDEYIALMKKLGVAVAIHDDDEFRFAIGGFGFAGKGWRAAITYREAPPTPLIESLDSFRRVGGMTQAYRRIDPNWYGWIIW